ncbi:MULTISPECIES: hypothetical protein [Bradyrhizobium]|uniref:Uncharacterized protein n=1 Tax=Bradyrhizobium barranii TaxID=2992140 RepID=A0ABY3QIJ9_9BRAD|nr:hypothetical protein [Bradyrhizobium japonicum]UFW85643.1 hypothetical protein BjapCC829_37955 [Bradyrhizobium japonicum]
MITPTALEPSCHGSKLHLPLVMTDRCAMRALKTVPRSLILAVPPRDGTALASGADCWAEAAICVFYSLAFGAEGGRSRTENGWIAVPFCDRIHQSFDFSIQLSKLLFETLPFSIRCDCEALSLFEISTHVLRNNFRRAQFSPQTTENCALNRV